MAGNVAEWVNDWYQSGYYAVSPPNDPQGPVTGAMRVLRGGPWAFREDLQRVALRNAFYPSAVDYLIGFRCSR
jgi:formylglycine-generating enzyme required for sulfatase activity